MYTQFAGCKRWFLNGVMIPSGDLPFRARVAAWRALYDASFKLGLVSLSARFAARASTAQLSGRGIDRPSVVISGLGRSGKTILANRLSARYGYQRFGTDHCLDYFFRITDDSQRLRFRERFYSSIVRRFPDGLVIEGDDFILRNRVTYAKTNHPIDIGPALTLSDRFGTEVFLLGNTKSPDELIAAFEVYSSGAECWTTSLRDVRKYALWLIRVSQTLRALADGERIHYLEVDSIRFDEWIDATADMIASRGCGS